MKRLERILVATDLSENSRNGFLYACSLATDNNATLTLVHVANQFEAWKLYSDDFSFLDRGHQTWPADRVLSEAGLDLNRFLEPHLEEMRKIHSITKRVLWKRTVPNRPGGGRRKVRPDRHVTAAPQKTWTHLDREHHGQSDTDEPVPCAIRHASAALLALEGKTPSGAFRLAPLGKARPREAVNRTARKQSHRRQA